MTENLKARIEVIYTFDDIEQQIDSLWIDLDDTPVLTEARVLRALLEQLSETELDQLCKCSICVQLPEDADVKTVAPWIFDKDSPLFNGKLWLKQYNYATT